MLKLFTRTFLLAATIFSLTSVPALAAKSRVASPSSPTGNDISWPQCGKRLPSGQAFGIVGVNGGLANTTNSCLASQLVWSERASGVTSQVKSQLYVNTANPGGLNTASWPTSNIDPAGNPAANPYGTCNGSDSLPCAWQYGWNRALEDVRDRFLPAAQAAGVSTSAANYPWWLDVETQNTWKTGSSFAIQSNVADLEGMTSYFSSVGATVGLYSTGSQLHQIAGTVNGSNLNGIKSWLAGSRSLSGAKSNCSLPPLTGGGAVALTQYVSGGFDYDYSCV